MADKQNNKGKEKMRCSESLSDDSDSDSVRPCKRPRRAAPETTPEQQSAQGSLKIRDRKGWQHGTIIDGNRNWQCKYCPMVGRSGGVTSLKHHVAGGSSRVRACPSAPKHVANEVRRWLDRTRRKPRKWTARKGTAVQPAVATTTDPNNSVPRGSTDNEEGSAFPSPASFMTRLVDMMLAAAEVLSKEEQAKDSEKKP
ncbi:uncharacterized protein [Triticum aestivum]|uniref:uncharacterized protein n=1 Tax=Triticum aestivum TaxID=4565 RepID=UPI0008454488|nr:uncharacterized protein LOC123058943 [Triticum aestivum]